MDISYCDDKTGFPRPGHIYYQEYTIVEIEAPLLLLYTLLIL